MNIIMYVVMFSRIIMNINIYYGERPSVLHGRIVTIHNCQHVVTTIDSRTNLEELRSYVSSLLDIDQQSSTVSLEGVRPRPVPNSSIIVYTLFELSRNNAWALYVRKAREEDFELGVYVNIVSHVMNPTATEGLGHHMIDETVHVHVQEGTSGAEAAEDVGTEVDAMCMDDESGGSEDEAAVDNEDPTPAIEYFRGGGLLDCVIPDYDNLSTWGFQSNDIQIGQRFRSKEEVIHFISNFGATTRREHTCTRSNRTEYEVRCTRALNCPFYVRAHKPKQDNFFVIVRSTAHTCSDELVRNMSHIVDARFIAQLLITQIGKDVELSLKSIMEQVLDRTRMNVNYCTAWRAKQKALKMLFGSFEDSYNNAPRLLQKISLTNPGTQFAMADEPVLLDDGSYSTSERYLIRFFWAFGQCIEAI